MNAYAETREQLLRRAAAGEDVTKAIDKLDADQVAGKRAAALSADIEATRQTLAREDARAALQAQYDETASAFTKAADAANKLAVIAELAFADAVVALNTWRDGMEAARTIGTQAHHLMQQGASPTKLPILPGTGELSIHMLRRFGDRHWQESLWGNLPRTN